MRPRRSPVVPAAFVAVLALPALASCMATGSDAAGGGSGASGGADKRLRVGLTWISKKNLSPYSSDALLMTRSGVGETLLRWGPEGHLEPGLAESFERRGDTTVVFRLRRGVHVQDGTPMNAPAVAGALSHMIAATPGPETLADTTLRARAVGQDVVEVRSAGPDPLLAQRFAYGATMILSPRAYQPDPRTPSVLGTATGPYRVTKILGKTGFTAERFEGYWGGRPKASGLDVRFIPDGTARMGALRSGQIDIAEHLPLSRLAELAPEQVQATPSPRLTAVFFNVKQGPFTNPAVRSAAVRALRAQTLVDGPFQGKATTTGSLFPTLAGSPDPAPAALPPPANPPAAPITIATYTDRPELPDTVSIVADQLRKAGFTVNPPVVKSFELLEKDLLRGRYDAAVTSQQGTGSLVDPVAGLRMVAGCTGTFNVSQFCDSTVDAELNRAAAVVDQRARHIAVNAIEQRLRDAAVIAPLVREPYSVAFAPGVTGIAKDMFGWSIVTAQTSAG